MIYIENKHKHILLTILKKYPYTFYAYGSRVKGNHRPLSDLDLCFKDPIPLSIQARIEEELVESDLPFEVELSDYNLMKPEFRSKIDNDLIAINVP